MKAFHNTTDLEQPEVDKANEKALTQDEIVLAEIKIHYYNDYPITPHGVLKHLRRFTTRFNHVPETSIRRAFTNLKNRGLIRKTGNKIVGQYGSMVNTWELVQ